MADRRGKGKDDRHGQKARDPSPASSRTQLAEIARPDVAAITNVGPVHLEKLGTLEAIAEAKAEILAGLGERGTAVIPAARRVGTTTPCAPNAAADRTTATSPEIVSTPAGSFVRPDASSYLVRAGDRTILVAAHQSKAGPMALDELWATVPVWKSIASGFWRPARPWLP